MDTKLLGQYKDITHEIEETRRRIRDIEERLSRMESVCEVVKGGSGGNRRIKVEGKPTIQNQKTDLLAGRLRLNILVDNLETIKNQIEVYIHAIDNSRIRRIMTFRYIDGLTWDDVAYNMGEGYTGDSVRIEHKRFLDKMGDGR